MRVATGPGTSERQIDVTSATYVSVSSPGAPRAFATAVGPAL